MIEFQIERKFEFPLFDESQGWQKLMTQLVHQIFISLMKKLDLIYRGRMDDSRPGNQKEITGEDLIIAFENSIVRKSTGRITKPSMGCNIKWK